MLLAPDMLWEDMDTLASWLFILDSECCFGRGNPLLVISTLLSDFFILRGLSGVRGECGGFTAEEGSEVADAALDKFRVAGSLIDSMFSCFTLVGVGGVSIATPSEAGVGGVSITTLSILLVRSSLVLLHDSLWLVGSVGVTAKCLTGGLSVW